MALTGQPTQRIDHSQLLQTEDLWCAIQQAIFMNFIITGQLYEREDDRETRGEQQPRSAHSLAVLSTHTVSEDGSHYVRLVKIRDSMDARKYCENNAIAHGLQSF